jgi:hypothetical protein
MAVKSRLTLAPLLLVCAPVFGAVPFNCNRGIPLQKAIDFSLPGETLELSGTCSGAVVITAKNLAFISHSGAVIDGGGKDAITVNGPARLIINGVIIQHGHNGVTATAGAQLTFISSTVQNNSLNGIFLAGGASATLVGTKTNGNTVSGLDAEASSSVILTGSYQSSGNGVFGININSSSSLTFSRAQVNVSGNTLGIQIGTSASAFISDPNTTIDVSNNATTGLTIVSGSHMVAFGGTIQATGNGFHGVSIDSKAGLDLDAAAVLSSSGNMQDGIHLEETSVLTLFNTTAFSGAPGTTTINVQNNRMNGISVLTGSNLTVIHQAAINSTGNTSAGIQVDNGSGLTLIQSIVTSNGKDIVLSFGSRGDISGSTVGTLTCDASVLLRNYSSKCPL